MPTYVGEGIDEAKRKVASEERYERRERRNAAPVMPGGAGVCPCGGARARMRIRVCMYDHVNR